MKMCHSDYICELFDIYMVCRDSEIICGDRHLGSLWVPLH